MKTVFIILVLALWVWTGCDDLPECCKPPHKDRVGLINPDSGRCQLVDYCTFCTQPNGRSWSPCVSDCTDLPESACQVQAGCHAAFADGEFLACWKIVQWKPQSALCENRDASDCIAMNDCVSNYSNNRFVSCAAEKPLCRTNAECLPSEYCSAPDICLVSPSCPDGDECVRGCWGYCEG